MALLQSKALDSPKQDDPLRIRPLRRVEYDRLVELGVFGKDDKIELLRGALVEMSPQGSQHADCAGVLMTLLIRMLGDRASVRAHSPFAATEDSEPEPDVGVYPPRRYAGAHPKTAFLVVEVAESSLRKDRGLKSEIYAENGVPEYWIVEFLADRDTPTVPTDRYAAMAALRRDRVVAIRIYGSGREIELPPDADRILIGAGASAHIQLEDPYISAAHCELERRPHGRLLVRDLGSKNGSFVNGNRVEIAELAIGAVLTTGRTGLLALGRRSSRQPSARELLVGDDAALRAALDQATLAAATSCNVLVVGETGTGKELVARAIHEASARALGPFVPVNCGAIPAELAESELFGHERGAFTGATAERDGYFVQADGGTLFLDEIGELPRAQQPHLLRALESRRVRRVGGHRERAVDIRLISATNRLDLDSGSSPLRTDLYHRVATVVLELPPLRERASDIPLLVETFLAELEPEFGRREIAADTLAALADHPWPGNVRELRHAVHRAAALSANQLRIEDLLPRRALPAPTPTALADDMARFDVALRDVLRAAYREHGSVRRAAAALGIPKSTFADRARRLGIL